MITLLLIYRTWNGVGPLEAAQSVEWAKERAQVSGWLHTLQNRDTPLNVFELYGGSFWVGYHTYRVMKTESFWIFAKFTKQNLGGPLEYRIRELNVSVQPNT